MKMKKILSVLISASLLIVPAVGLALVGEIPPEEAPTVVSSGADLIAKITQIGNWFFVILLALAAFILIWAGLDFVTGGGDETKMKAARQKLIYALVGVAVALGARGLVAAVRSIIGGQG